MGRQTTATTMLRVWGAMFLVCALGLAMAPGEAQAGPRSMEGKWRDSNGQDIECGQKGSMVTARMISPGGQRWWQDARGSNDGTFVKLTFHNRGKAVDTQTGRFKGSDRVDWGNGTHWVRTSAPGLEDNMDRPGADLRQTRTSTPSQCRDACEAEGRCLSFTHHKGVCYLKSGVPGTTYKAGCVSGIVRSAPAPSNSGLEYNMDRYGADLRQVRTSTPEQCRDACKAEGRCRSFTHAGGVCYLKHGVPRATPKANNTSGVVR